MQTLNNMKNRKGILSKGILLLSFIATGFVSQSQSLQETIRMAENQRYEKAKESFRRLVQLEPKNGNIYYYFGETYFNQDTALIDSADLVYKKGSEAEPFNPLNFVGLGKVLWFKNYQNGAETLFTQALEMTKYKNATVMMKIAENYINAKNKNLPKANELLNKALKLEPKNPEIHLLLGDAMLEANPQDGSGPVKKYSEAIELDKSSAKAILRIGKLYYRAKNPTEALKWYKEAIKIDSTFAPVYIEMGELYLMAGLNKQSLEQYKKYLALNNDLEARTRLAQILWVNKFFEEAIREVTNIHQTDSSSIYLYRILGYSYSEVGDKFPPDGYKKGLVAINKFFDMAAAKKGFKLLASDFSAKGKLLSKTGQDSLAMIELKKALELDSTVTDLYSDIAFAYYKSKKYNDALTYYLKKIAAGKPTINDYVYLGLSYYQTKQFALADSAFKKVISVSPDLILAHKWRAKSNSQLDPDSKLALAKPHFEKVVELILAKPEALEKNKKDLIEAYEYLISYHLLIMKDSETATPLIDKVKEIDPTNKKLEAFYKVIEELKKKN